MNFLQVIRSYLHFNDFQLLIFFLVKLNQIISIFVADNEYRFTFTRFARPQTLIMSSGEEQQHQAAEESPEVEPSQGEEKEAERPRELSSSIFLMDKMDSPTVPDQITVLVQMTNSKVQAKALGVGKSTVQTGVGSLPYGREGNGTSNAVQRRERPNAEPPTANSATERGNAARTW